ncbi:MAG: S49 family peptidase, partial [Bacteroidales bacterium]
MLHRHSILNGIWLIQPSMADSYLPMIVAWIKGTPLHMAEVKECSAYSSLSESNLHNVGYDDFGKCNVYLAPKGSIAVIRINGAMTSENQACGPIGLKQKANQLRACYANPNIKGVIFSISSGGGEVNAAIAIQEAIRERNKPVVAFVEDCACSAAYIGFCGCDAFIVANKYAEVGSIGVITSFMDARKYIEAQGINFVELYATKSNRKNEEFRAAINGDNSLLQAS